MFWRTGHGQCDRILLISTLAVLASTRFSTGRRHAGSPACVCSSKNHWKCALRLQPQSALHASLVSRLKYRAPQPKPGPHSRIHPQQTCCHGHGLGRNQSNHRVRRHAVRRLCLSTTAQSATAHWHCLPTTALAHRHCLFTTAPTPALAA